MLIDEKTFEKELSDTLEVFKSELKKVKAGKASVDIFEEIQVECYGGVNKLNTLGQILVEDAMNLKIVVWDKSVLQSVEKALREAETGGSVAVDKDFIRIKFNPMTEEDRKLRIKELGELAENFRVRTRHIRQKFMKMLEGLKSVSEDEKERDEKKLQKRIDETIDTIDSLTKEREAALLKF